MKKQDSYNNFYCQNVCGDAEFSIAEWNEQFKICNDLNIELPEAEPCKKQCFDCMANVGDRRIKTKKLLERLKSKELKL